MFNGRRFQLTILPKTDKTPKTESTASEIASNDYAQIVRESLQTVAKYGAIAVAGYIVLDTGRQCAVKATPQR